MIRKRKMYQLMPSIKDMPEYIQPAIDALMFCQHGVKTGQYEYYTTEPMLTEDPYLALGSINGTVMHIVSDDYRVRRIENQIWVRLVREINSYWVSADIQGNLQYSKRYANVVVYWENGVNTAIDFRRAETYITSDYPGYAADFYDDCYKYKVYPTSKDDIESKRTFYLGRKPIYAQIPEYKVYPINESCVHKYADNQDINIAISKIIDGTSQLYKCLDDCDAHRQKERDTWDFRQRERTSNNVKYSKYKGHDRLNSRFDDEW